MSVTDTDMMITGTNDDVNGCNGHGCDGERERERVWRWVGNNKLNNDKINNVIYNKSLHFNLMKHTHPHLQSS